MKRTRYSKATAALGALATLASSLSATAQSVDALLDKLVDKGVLTVREAQDLREESDKDFTRAYASKSGMPEWVTALKLNGDFRGRYEGFYYNDIPGAVDRHRWRYRVRFGVTANLWDNFEVGLRLASGDLDNAAGMINGADPISNNQTLQNNASKKGVFIDLAYGKWTAINTPEWQGVLTIGKMENPFVFSDMVFDRDYTPEGAAMNWTYNFNDEQSLKFNGAAFALEELSGSSRDPYMFGAQARWDALWHRGDGGAKDFSSTLGLGVLNLWHKENLKEVGTAGAEPDINKGNLRTGTARSLVHNYNPIVADAALTYKLPSMWMYSGTFPISLAGDYMHNPAAPSRNSGFSVGITFGKAGKRRTWDIGYRYKLIEGDAWYEEVVDSDFGSYYQAPSARSDRTGQQSGTNVRGHIVKADWSPSDAVTLTLTYFLAELVDASPIGSESISHRVQVDAVWKF